MRQQRLFNGVEKGVAVLGVMVWLMITAAYAVMNQADSSLVLVVSVNGLDSNSGTKASPLASLGKAKEIAKTWKAAGNKGAVTIMLTGGTYYLDNPLVFGAEESGTPDAPYTIRAKEGETVIISGAARLNLLWERYDDRIWCADVGSGVTFQTLFANGESLIRARYPDFELGKRPFGGYAADVISNERIAKWKNPQGGYIHALHRARWGGMHYHITGKSGDTLQYEGGWQNNRPSGMHARYRYVENIFEELDRPGEWYLDTDASKLYYYPKSGQSIHQLQFEASLHEQLILLKGSEDAPVHDIVIAGLSFVHTAPTFMKTNEPLMRSDWAIHRGGAMLLEGTERCTIVGNNFRQLAGNAIFLSRYNRETMIAENLIEEIGANAICLIGDAEAVRSPSFRYELAVDAHMMDTIPGPIGGDFPQQCIIADNLIRQIGLIEKQVSGVQIQMAADIRVTHNTIYELPRAGINIGDGAWGGHIIEYNDVFETVLETNDHGAFNSWGRDRFWHPDRKKMDSIVAEHPNWVTLDAVKTTIIRHNRFRCDHGWDIDLDDGSTNYEIYNNLCLSGGIKLREGFYRRVYNNIMVNNGFHPHVWFKNSRDVARNNIVMTPHQDIRLQAWGDTVDYNVFNSQNDLKRSQYQGAESHGMVMTLVFKNPEQGDYTVENADIESTHFVNFPMDQFGVRSSRLKKLAIAPRFGSALQTIPVTGKKTYTWLGVTVKNIESLAEQSAAGLPEIAGVLVLNMEAGAALLSRGVLSGDVIISFNGHKVDHFEDLTKAMAELKEEHPVFEVVRNQRIIKLSF